MSVIAIPLRLWLQCWLDEEPTLGIRAGFDRTKAHGRQALIYIKGGRHCPLMLQPMLVETHVKKLGAVIAVAVLVLILTWLSIGPAAARGWHHWHGGWGWGGSITLGLGPWWGYPYGYNYPYAYAYPTYPYAYPYSYAAPMPAPAPPPSPSVWYYCRPKKAYYPYVSSCPNAWEQVPAQPTQ